MKITRIERIDVEIPMAERVREPLRRGWGLANRATDEEFAASRAEYEQQARNYPDPMVKAPLYLVHTDEGLVGLGEGGAGLTAEELGVYAGRDPFEFIMDDSVGPLQLAFYDLMGKAVGLPVARLFGPHRGSAPIAYWSHCFAPDIMQQEAERAIARGFKTHKFKRRAHTDVVEQVAAIAQVAPDDYEITVDANQTFGTLDRALATGRALEAVPQVKCLESPIEQGDADGLRLLKRELRFALAHHIGNPDPVEALQADLYDYFILGGGAARIVRDAHLCQARDKPFWMQQDLSNTDLSVMFMMHLAAAIPNATLSHVSYFQLMESGLLQEELVVQDGYIRVPDGPGLDVELDMDAVEKYRVG
ncbi:MAG: hypothetical protein GKR89_13865 [Candidatus Latescibacteria bacterium]|nr:hypothetical protein [Candidatus Latescibacterota bacterium]